MEFPKDEVKNKIVWTKGADFTDGSPRYTFEGRDPATTYERFQVVMAELAGQGEKCGIIEFLETDDRFP